MNSTKCLLALTTIALVFASLTWAADDKDESDINKRIDASARVLNEVMATPDKAIPDSIMNDARCIAVVPSMIKIAVGFGGNHGKGVATCRTSSGWSAPAPITITGGRGLFAGIDLSGAVINQDKDDTRILFGKMVPFETILSGKVAAPDGSGAFLAAVRKYSSQAKDQAANTDAK
jgi:lipid-binding SYLF domain-containing protein